MSTEVDRATERWKDLNTSGLLRPGVSPTVDPDALPAWISRERLLVAQRNLQPHMFSVNFSSLSGLLIILQTRYGFDPLLYTGKSESLPALFLRYLKTMIHVRSWYTTDILDPESEGYKSIRQVRQMHVNISKKMQSLPPPCADKIWVSQYSMAATQWSFVGLLLLFPERCGLHGQDKQVLQDVNYLWRVIGYLHGIEDRYNMCFEDVQQTINMCQLMLDNLFGPVLCRRPRENELGYEMVLDIVESLKGVLTGASGDVYLRYWYEALEMREELMPVLSLNDRMHYHLLTFVTGVACRSHTLKVLIDKASLRRVKHYSAVREKHFQLLLSSHPEVKYTPEEAAKRRLNCPFAAAVNNNDTTNAGKIERKP